MIEQTIPFAKSRTILADSVEMAGGISEWARRHGMAKSTVSEMLNGKRPVTRPALNAMGYAVREVIVSLKGNNSNV